MSKIAELNETSFEDHVIKADGPVLVDFYAPWCGPCKMLAPALDSLAEEMDGKARIVKVNVDEAANLAARYSITGVPTLLFFKNGEVADTVVGMAPPAALKSKLEALA